MIRYFLKALAAHFRQGRTLFVLSVMGVALGVASVLAIQIINRNAISAFSAGLQAVSGETDLRVIGTIGSFDERRYPDILAVEGVAAAWPLYQVEVALTDRPHFFLEVVGVDFFSGIRLPWEASVDDFSRALFEPGWVAVSPRLADQMGWSVGDSFQVSSGTRLATLVIGTLVDFQEVTPLASRKLAVMDIAQVQGLLGHRGRIHQVDVQIQAGMERKELSRRLRNRLGAGVQVVTAEQQEQQAVNLMEAFRLNLTALSLISLFVGVFLVHTSTQASLLRRRREFGLLRSLGATRWQVFGIILAEVALLGFLGVLLGLPMGYWVAQANVDMVSATLTNLYLLQEIQTLHLPPWLFLLAALIGIGGAVGGALFPALDMSRKDTKSLLVAFTLHEKVSTLALPLFLLAWGMGGGALIWFWAWGQYWKPAGFVLAVVLLLALPLLNPFLVKQICERVPIRGFGLGYSLKTLATRLQTTSFAVSSLTIAVSMLVGITLMVGSFRRTLEVWVDTTVRADIYITTESFNADPEATMDDELVSGLGSHPGVVAIDRLRRLLVEVDGRRISLAGVDMGLADGQSRFPLMKGDPQQARRAVADGSGVLITEPLARKSQLDVGDMLAVESPRGTLQFPIAGIYYDYSSEAGSAAMDLEAMNKTFGPGAINSVALYLRKERDPEQVIDELKSRFPSLPLRMRSNRHLRQEILRIFDQTFAVVRILQVMSLLIAVCGIMLTLLVLARERISELALYRSLGAHRYQIFRVFVGKGVGIALIGLGVGLVGGMILAAILIFVINRTYFGWTIQVYWPGWSVLWQVAAILAAAFVASLYPAFKASGTPATQLARDDL